MSKKEQKPRRINVRVTDEHFEWFETNAKNRKVGISQFLRLIPKIIYGLESRLDEKESEIIKLENENIKLRAKIFNLEKKK